MLLRMYSFVGEYLVRLFLGGRMLAPCFGEGVLTWPNTCFVILRGYSSDGWNIAQCSWESIRPSNNICLTSRVQANEYEYLFVYVFVRGVLLWPSTFFFLNRVFAKVRFFKCTSKNIVPKAIFAVHFLKKDKNVLYRRQVLIKSCTRFCLCFIGLQRTENLFEAERLCNGL